MITKEIWRRIENAQIITIFRHTKPDGDATGSQLGLKELINTNLPNKEVYCLGDPNAYYGRLVGNVDIGIDDDVIAGSLAIILDTPNIERVDNSSFLRAKEIIKIDHHLFVDTFSSLEWIDNTMGSTCEMIVKLAYENDLKISRSCGECLYLGMVTDTNRFLYTTSNHGFKAATYLSKTEIDYNRIYDFLYECEEKMIRFKGYCQLSYKRTLNGVAYNKINEDVLDRFDVTGHDAAGVVNTIAGIKGVKIHVHFCAIEDELIRVEFRSKKIPVNEIAKKYGGGGHRLASGTKVNSWGIVDDIIKDLDDLCRED